MPFDPRHTRRAAVAALATMAAVFLASCSDAPAPPFAPDMARSNTKSATAAPGVSQHVFLLNNGIPSGFDAQVRAHGGSVLREHGAIGLAVTRGLTDADAQMIAATAGTVVRDTSVRWVPAISSVRIGRALATRPVTTSILPPQAAFFLAAQWNLFQIHAPEAWTQYTGAPAVRVAILDTGLDPNHLDQFGLIDAQSSVAFVPSVTGPPAWADDDFHGTFVGGEVTSNNFGTAGVVSNVTLVAVKVLDATGSGSFADIIAGIMYATDAHVQVINMSLGAIFPKNEPGASQLVAALNRAINYAHSHDVLVVSAAGNDDVDLQHDGNYIEVPCETGVGMCVSATNIADVKASYSNYGTNAINVAAPGGDLDFADPTDASGFVLGLCSSHSADPALAICKDGSHYIFAAGTSMAAPEVSGLGAYLDSQYGGTLNASQMITRIQQNADAIGGSGASAFYGKGRINVAATLNAH